MEAEMKRIEERKMKREDYHELVSYVRYQKELLEEDIEDLIAMFEITTGIKVETIGLERVSSIPGRDIKVKVRACF